MEPDSMTVHAEGEAADDFPVVHDWYTPRTKREEKAHAERVAWSRQNVTLAPTSLVGAFLPPHGRPE